METTERRRGVKYMEGYLEVKESSKWVIYWVVIRGSQLFFFKDADTKIKENIQGHVDIGPKSTFTNGKSSKGKFEFEVKEDRGKKYILRASSELLRLQWVHSLGLAAQGKSPPPLFISDQEAETPGEAETCKPPLERKTSNQYTEVPDFNIRADVACEVTDEEMQKMSLKKHNSFSAHCKRLLGRKKDSLSKTIEEEEDRQPVSEGAEAVSEPFYDIFPGEKPAWYFGKLTREQSETILQKYGPGRFLVRDSESVHKPGAYTLSLKHRDRCRHHKIETLTDGNLVIKQHEDKPFPNLATLMKYFVKSQEKDILLVPVICEEQEGTNAGASSPGGQQGSYEIMDKRPPAVGCEDRSITESSSGSTPLRLPHGYENLPTKQRAHPPPLKSRMTEPALPTYPNYRNMPPKANPLMASQTPPMPAHPATYEAMTRNGFATNSSFEEPRPSLPPRRPVKATGHGYENLPEKPIPPREPTGVGYINLPSKSERSGSDPPELPPRSPRAHTLGYENVPSSVRTLPPSSSSYQNILPSVHGRHSLGSMMTYSTNEHSAPPPMKRAATLPAHIIQNTLGQMNINEDPY